MDDSVLHDSLLGRRREGLTVSEMLQISSRLRSGWAGAAMAPSNAVALCASVSSVFAIAACEAVLLSKPGHRSARFVCSYAAHQIFPSIIWLTKPANKIAASLALDPAKILRSHDLQKPKHAQRLLRVTTLQTLRSVLAGFVGIGQILRLVALMSDAEVACEQRVMPNLP